MNQNSYQALTKMLTGFRVKAEDTRELLLTFDEDLTGVSDEAIAETARRYSRGEVDGQNTRFIPTTAEFRQEAVRMATLLPYRGRPALPKPQASYVSYSPDSAATRIRMGFKMSVLSASIPMHKVDMVAEANKRGLEDMIALGQQWGIPVPEELWAQLKSAA